MFLMLLSAVGAIGGFFVLLAVSYRASGLQTKSLSIMVTFMVISVFDSFLLRPEIPIAPLFWHLVVSRAFSRQSGSAWARR
ncbi:hypothetical protein B6V73_16560 [Thioclava sp. JM3]|uniref:hypothetical protein n=1 Tax=Thioclava sp. JM3 TaxID=1973004 RepID=UPI000B5417D5|nr:hypothetical protein [Thioclava sp. JM3]OWY14208.1 hypothetical protein B6V73_16560 [Thioclava sp. JM3]